MERDGHGFRVFCFSAVVLLFACLVAFHTVILAAPQSPSPADENKQQEKKPKDDVTKNTPG
ncbi:MAG: hypothetical protein WA621_06685, partial [Candidatus Acidiferrum sp.]